MQANKDHISFETAKLLKECGANNKEYYVWSESEIISKIELQKEINEWAHWVHLVDKYPAFTWQEILWEYPQEFFGSDTKERLTICTWVMYLLQQKKYEEADLYFREHCILIKK